MSRFFHEIPSPPRFGCGLWDGREKPAAHIEIKIPNEFGMVKLLRKRTRRQDPKRRVLRQLSRDANRRFQRKLEGTEVLLCHDTFTYCEVLFED